VIEMWAYNGWNVGL